MAKLWPGVRRSDERFADIPHARAVEDSIPLPPTQVQDHLVEVFFTYANPCIPILDEESFMAQYKARYVFGLSSTSSAILKFSRFPGSTGE